MLTEHFHANEQELRLLVLTPTSKDARLTCQILESNGISCLPCADLYELCRQLREGAGGALIAEEFFGGEGAKALLRFLDEQPAWSDLPIMFLTLKGEHSARVQHALEALGNVLLLERPTKTSMLVSAARAVLRERQRQYQTRHHLDMLDKAKNVAEEANRAKSEFLASMSHEIRTPMTVFMAAIEHLLQTDRNPDRRHLLSMADASAHRLRNLIDDILDFSRIEARKVEIEQEPFDLRDCLREALEMFTLPAGEKNLKLNMKVTTDTPEKVVGDRNRVGQVLINLISNAVKFTPEGEVRVSVRPCANFLEFSVADTGIGIPEEKQHLLFKSFSQVDMSFHRQHGGSGLGLAICKGLVELMGGEISVRSHVGKGSLFSFTLPYKAVTEPKPEPAREKFDECDNKQQLDSLRILLVDDEPMIREMIAMMLEKRGLKVESAENGGDALKKWETGNFDIILMDLQMPGMNGMEATRSIREKVQEGDKRPYIIGLTAHVRREIKEECLASGMDRVLVKPIKMSELFSAIDDFFHNDLKLD
ncbi:MAG: response regulator [Syntrophotaleaceae bacterium]